MIQSENRTYTEILDFWFSNENKERWFGKDEKFDNLIRERFLTLYEQAAQGMLDNWKQTPAGILALIILLDQFSRNMFRGDRRSYATDHQALSLAKEAINKGMDKKLSESQRKFIYMPLMHSENLEDQQLSVQLFANDTLTYFYATRHMEIIRKFGRFPHRNAILGRKSTNEELIFLKESNASF
ncbi:MAG: hypothetical protein BGO68_03535 [Candidatus Amoebophilus sp. 36-38]|nr:MAG: hypothetical protein BGO68_03535 [Candidatus Amoebophilus sp. 36-38]